MVLVVLGVILQVLIVVFVLLEIIALCKSRSSIYEDEPDQKNPFEGKLVEFVYDDSDEENADGVRGHLKAIGDTKPARGIYVTAVKRFFDIVLSFFGLVILSPLFLGLVIAIKIDDPGPVLFTQKRVGRNKRYFKLHKFRSMKMTTPHDVPTHMLEDPDRYITKVGRWIRAHSLDELPQIWDIFIGNMSVVGPRPALWNQDLLTGERDKYGVNDITPGLTGWAQIHGRDCLELVDKARADGEYTRKIGVVMDIKCFLGSLGVFFKDSTVVEGGTGRVEDNE